MQRHSQSWNRCGDTKSCSSSSDGCCWLHCFSSMALRMAGAGAPAFVSFHRCLLLVITVALLCRALSGV
jgi:hypothetical protein